MMPTVIRPASLHELGALHALVERAYRGDGARAGWTHEADLIEGARTTLDALRDICTGDRSRLFIASRDGVAIGCVAIWDRGDGLAYLGQLCVEPTLQDAGVGRQLVAAAEAAAAALFAADRMEMTVIDVRETLVAWYGRCGYRPTGERRDFPVMLDPPLHMVVLAKALKGR